MGGRDRGGRMGDMGPDKTDSDWRARPSSDADDGPPRRDDPFGESKFSSIFFFIHKTDHFFLHLITVFVVGL